MWYLLSNVNLHSLTNIYNVLSMSSFNLELHFCAENELNSCAVSQILITAYALNPAKREYELHIHN